MVTITYDNSREQEIQKLVDDYRYYKDFYKYFRNTFVKSPLCYSYQRATTKERNEYDKYILSVVTPEVFERIVCIQQIIYYDIHNFQIKKCKITPKTFINDMMYQMGAFTEPRFIRNYIIKEFQI